MNQSQLFVRKGTQMGPGSERGSQDGELNAQTIAEALNELERMIDEEKRQKNQLERRFDDIYSQGKDFQMKDQKSSNLRRNSSLNYLESMAQEILTLVQKRNELSDTDNIFSVLKRNANQTTDYKNMVMNQLAMGRPSSDFTKRGGQRKTTHQNQSTGSKLYLTRHHRHSAEV